MLPPFKIRECREPHAGDRQRTRKEELCRQSFIETTSWLQCAPA